MNRSDVDHIAAFAAYERRMRPFVALNQALATENPGGPASEKSVDRAKNGVSTRPQADEPLAILRVAR
ncbi:hypothetical protein ACWDKQ_13065 [Saccharopolyspora sp. NPDC000995]